jgi:hypothetical protein
MTSNLLEYFQISSIIIAWIGGVVSTIIYASKRINNFVIKDKCEEKQRDFDVTLKKTIDEFRLDLKLDLNRIHERIDNLYEKVSIK